jgi:hypothetical protein
MGKLESYTPLLTTYHASNVVVVGNSQDTDSDGDYKTRSQRLGVIVAAAGGGGSIGFQLRGNAYVDTGIMGVMMGESKTIDKVVVYSDDAPLTSSLIVDINKNGTTIFTTQSKRPIVTPGNNTDDSDTPDVTSLAQDDRVTVDIDQIGSGTVGGNNLYVTIVFS